jgi:hypothetical protein
MRLGFIVAVGLLIFITLRIPAKPRTLPSPVLESVISLLALANVLFGFFAPRFLALSFKRGASNLQPFTPVKRWLTGCIFSLACFDACCMFAFVMHFVGGQTHIVQILFGAGILSLLFWNPGNPPIEEETFVQG